MSEANFSRTMSGLPEEDLIRIAFSREEDGYLPEAIHAAKEEVNRRCVTENAISETMDDFQKEIEIDSRKHLIPLGNRTWMCFVFLGPTLPGMIAAVLLGTRGYKQKFKDAWHAIFVGFAVYGCVAILISILISFGF